MIFYLSRSEHDYTMGKYLQGMGQPIAGRISLVDYGELLGNESPPPGKYIFSDIERLSLDEMARASRLWKRIAELYGKDSLLNHPTRSMRRYELLRNLHAKGWNRFNVYRLTEARDPEGYPVFLRKENSHMGHEPPVLLKSPRELALARRQLFYQGVPRESVLITEFVDLADSEGVFRKYSAFNVGGVFLPRHVFFSRTWLQKLADLSQPERLVEEEQFMTQFPHRDQVRDVFAFARIQYGRIDYGVMPDGQIQVWEINTNPMIVTEGYSPDTRSRFAADFAQEFNRLITIWDELPRREANRGPRLPLEPPDPV